MSQTELVKKDKQQGANWLIENFPQAFFKKSSEVKPLQIGIFKVISEFFERLELPPFSKKILREGLKYYSSSPAYLSCQKEGVARIDLYGNEMDVVTKEQAEYAYQRYQERYQSKKNQSLTEASK